jgi:hypothetical protein
VLYCMLIGATLVSVCMARVMLGMLRLLGTWTLLVFEFEVVAKEVGVEEESRRVDEGCSMQ